MRHKCHICKGVAFFYGEMGNVGKLGPVSSKVVASRKREGGEGSGSGGQDEEWVDFDLCESALLGQGGRPCALSCP